MLPACLQDLHQPGPPVQGPASMQRHTLTMPCCMPAEAAPAPAPAPGAGLPASAAAASLSAPAPAPEALVPAAGASQAPGPAPQSAAAAVALLPAAGASQAPAPAPQSAAAAIASQVAPAPAPSNPSCQTGLQGYLQSNPNLTLLTTALSGSTQVSVQNPFTFFAPLDTAFQSIPGDLGEVQLLLWLQWGLVCINTPGQSKYALGSWPFDTPQGRAIF